MGPLAKLFYFPNKILAAFPLKVLPELLRLIMLFIYITWKYYELVTTKYKYVSAIDKKSSRFHYRKKARPGLGECSVCLSDFAEGDEGQKIAECKHTFHRSCLEKWLKEYKASCPLCRRRLRRSIRRCVLRN